MMTNLFSTFDPATSLNLSLNWISMMMPLILLPLNFWFLPSRYMNLMKQFSFKLHMEFKMLLGMNSKGLTILFVSLFLFILYNNIMGLMPYVFTASSHLAFTLTLSIPMWLSIMIFGWVNHTQHMLAHLIPEGSPIMLTPFMACIETVSNIIRPGSLAVRLAANMIAGHLLMCLLGNNTTSITNMILPVIITIQIILMMFETAVSIIQAYVFSVLSTLYTSEVNYENM